MKIHKLIAALLLLSIVVTCACASRQVAETKEKTVELYIPGCG